MLVRLNRSNLLHKYILYLSNYERKDYSLTIIIGVIRGIVPELGISLVRTIAKLSVPVLLYHERSECTR
jgi:hypothetical protein